MRPAHTKLAPVVGTSGPRIERSLPAHRDGLAALVSGVLVELGFSVDPVLDADLARPEEFYDVIWVVLDAQQVVGCVAMRCLGNGEAVGEAELKRMYLLPAYRGLGLGRKLLEAALGWARLEHVRAVRLDTGSDMAAAQRFYEAAGFERWGTRTEVGAGACRCELLYRMVI